VFGVAIAATRKSTVRVPGLGKHLPHPAAAKNAFQSKNLRRKRQFITKHFFQPKFGGLAEMSGEVAGDLHRLVGENL